MDFIDLDRRFRLIGPDETPADEEWALYGNEFLSSTSLSWDDILERRRTVLLAEAGSGKTEELRSKAKALRSEGRFALFAALEEMADGVDVVLRRAEREALEEWHAQDGTPGWLFLDSVDELKLSRKTLGRALRNAAGLFEDDMRRLRVILSSRPSDWRPGPDGCQFEEHFPLTRPEPADLLDPDEAFIGPLKENHNTSGLSAAIGETETAQETFGTVSLLPLDTSRIRKFVAEKGVADVGGFIDAVNREDGWTFARRPLDLDDQIRFYREHGRIGSRLEQHEASAVHKLRDDQDRSDAGVLSDVKAREGAERLALALTLMRRRTVLTSTDDDASHEGALNPADVLKDWTEEERRALLRHALFDPATFGRVRFHHRSVREYLAACRLHALRGGGLPVRPFLRLFFADMHGHAVVRPYLKDVAVWLALWDADVRRELMAREPDALMSGGDPASLDIVDKVALLHAFAERYGTGGQRGVNVPLADVRRLADPELAPTVRALWGAGPENDELRELLIELVSQGPIPDCADIAASVASNSEDHLHTRIEAIRALAAMGDEPRLTPLVADLLDGGDLWPARIAHGVAAYLFPRFLNVERLVALIERTEEPKRTMGGFNWAGRDIAETVDPTSREATDLLSRLSDLLERGWVDDGYRWRIVTRFAHMRETLAILCRRRIEAGRTNDIASLGQAAAVAVRMGTDDHTAGKPLDELARAVRADTSLRRAAFLTDHALLERFCGEDDWWHKIGEGVAGMPDGHDDVWLTTVVEDDGLALTVRRTALDLLLRAAKRRDHLNKAAQAWRDRLADKALKSVLDEWTREREPSKASKRLERRQRQGQLKRDRKESVRLEDWRRWRDGLMADPHAHFTAERADGTIYDLWTWQKRTESNDAVHVFWDDGLIAQAFGDEVAKCAASALLGSWRERQVRLWSERASDSGTDNEIWCAIGCLIEARQAGWADRLTEGAAERAVRAATVKFGSLSPFLADLVAQRPEAVRAVLGPELEAQMLVTETARPASLPSRLAYEDHGAAPLLAEAFLRGLAAIPEEPPMNDGSTASNLRDALKIVKRFVDPHVRRRIADVCDARFAVAPSGPLASEWLRGLSTCDGERGARALLTAFPSPRKNSVFVQNLLSIFDYHRHSPIDPATLSVPTLLALIRAAYAAIDPKDDVRREGGYTPDRRDMAQDVRSMLFGALMDRPGAAAHAARLDLANDPWFADRADRIRHLDRAGAAREADSEGFTAQDVCRLEDHLEPLVHTIDALHDTVRDRLDDLQHYLEHGDFSTRQTWSEVSKEDEMQRFLADRLWSLSAGVYTVTREPEVADRKKPDLELVAAADLRAAVEIKIGESWSVRQLEDALQTQLLGQYLRSERRAVGCLLVTCGNRTKRWGRSRDIDFATLIDRLQALAATLEAEAEGRRLFVYGLRFW